MLRPLLLALSLALGPAVAAAAGAEDFEAGRAAYEAGEPARAEAIWTPLAEQGDRLSLYALGKLYDAGGPGFAPDPARAAEWYRRAAAAGSADARNNLALLYAEGRGVERDPAAAAELWRRAAASGHPQAQYNLAMAHYEGLGVPQSLEEAAAWFRRAADNGLPEGQFALAELYRLGIGLPRDEALALTWYRRARAGGYAAAAAPIDELDAAGVEPAPLQPAAEAESPVTAAREELQTDALPPAQSVAPAGLPEAGTAVSDAPLVVAPAPAQTAMMEQAAQAPLGEAPPLPPLRPDGPGAEPEPEPEAVGQPEAPSAETAPPGAIQAGETAPGGLQTVERAVERPLPPVAPTPPPQPETPGRPGAIAGTPSAESGQEPASDPAEAAAEETADAVAPEPAREAVGAAEVAPAIEPAIEPAAAAEAVGEEQPEVAGEPAAEAEPPATVAAREVPEAAEPEAAPEPAPTPAPAREADPVPSGPFGIWLGSMQTREGAERLWTEASRRHPDELGGRPVVYVPVTADGRQFLRVVGAGYASRDEAAAGCRRIQALGGDIFCNVVRTE